MGNSITSINTIIRVNFLEIFEQINGVEEILKKDPADMYSKMDYKTRAYYRKEIEKIAKKTKISEIYIAKKCLELARNAQDKSKTLSEKIDKTENKASSGKEKQVQIQKQAHIGYYLISDGKDILISQLLNKKVKTINKKTKMKMYIFRSVDFINYIKCYLWSICV